ncbi:probable 39S ribosomal protein L24, mitochondrial [Schistocerca gregaria]|uniref:probable 39S ribosomal protein L24, mitochondrial n=1 Tax=Schistocerca gregaria TaxID=7010 RepID=UPI00211E7240|nr:probable 39S ribosomal protein L24, mitochondrial [Schistocerca gregaria]
MTDAQRQTQRFVYAPSPVHYSNVALVDPTDNKPTRIGFKFLEDGQKVRVSKRTGAIIPKPPVELKNEAKRTLNAKDTEPEYALLKTFDERTLNPLLLASQRHREWQLPNPFVFSGQGAEKQDREEKD